MVMILMMCVVVSAATRFGVLTLGTIRVIDGLLRSFLQEESVRKEGMMSYFATDLRLALVVHAPLARFLSYVHLRLSFFFLSFSLDIYISVPFLFFFLSFYLSLLSISADEFVIEYGQCCPHLHPLSVHIPH